MVPTRNACAYLFFGFFDFFLFSIESSRVYLKEIKRIKTHVNLKVLLNYLLKKIFKIFICYALFFSWKFFYRLRIELKLFDKKMKKKEE